MCFYLYIHKYKKKWYIFICTFPFTIIPCYISLFFRLQDVLSNFLSGNLGFPIGVCLTLSAAFPSPPLYFFPNTDEVILRVTFEEMEYMTAGSRQQLKTWLL